MAEFRFPSGRIELILGPMFAGKTTEMLRRLERCELANQRVICVKYDKDKRYSDEEVVVTHDLKKRAATCCSKLMTCFHLCLQYDVIGVDEGQFYPDIVEFCEGLANKGKVVLVAALDGDFLRRPIGHVLELISKCETITKISAICRITGKDAAFSKRNIVSDQIELIGGADIYEAASRKVHTGIDTDGTISLTIGPVKSGKTTSLISALNRHTYASRKVILLTSDTSKLPEKLRFGVKKIDSLPSIDELMEYDVIGIDDGEKYEGLADWADTAANKGKHVIVAALDGDTQMNAYPEIMNLFSKSENVRKLDSICSFTGLPAPFTILLKTVGKIPISRFAMLQNRVFA